MGLQQRMELIFSAITGLLSFIFQGALSVWDTLLNAIDWFIQPWRNLFWFCFNIYVCLWSEIGSLTVKILVLPFRIYDAMQKDDTMEIEMRKIQELYMESKAKQEEADLELEKLLSECRWYKELASKAEADKKAISKKFQVLQLQVLQLEEENDAMKTREERILKGIHEKTILTLQKTMGSNRSEMMGRCKNDAEMEHGNNDGFIISQPPLSPLKTIVAKTPPDVDSKHKVGNRLTPSQFDCTPKCTPSPSSYGGMSVNNRERHQGWEAAVLSSTFSVFLTLLVGTIAWQAEDPCVPLVIAVFMVVCMSLKTVSQFLLSVHDGLGFDAVALLSFNWFILGVLAYPVLPRIAQFMAPIGSRFGHWFLRFMGVSYVTEQLKSAFL